MKHLIEYNLKILDHRYLLWITETGYTVLTQDFFFTIFACIKTGNTQK